MAEDMTHPHEGLQERALREAKIAGALYAICTDVGELPDRTSPDDQPEMLLVTAEELDTICDRHIRDLLDVLPQQAATDMALIERAARTLCEFDGCDPDDDVIAGQAAAFENYGPRWQAMQRSEGQCGGRDYVEEAHAILALSTPTSQPPAAETRLIDDPFPNSRKSRDSFIDTIRKAAPNGEEIAVRYHANNDWSVANAPLSALPHDEEGLRHKFWMVICHASGGRLSKPEDVDRGINDICVQITQKVNDAYEAGKQAALTQPEPTAQQATEPANADFAVLDFAKARAWHHFGIAWDKLEQISRDELIASTTAMLSARVSAQQATDCPDCDGTGYRQASTAHKGGECPTCAATGDGPAQQGGEEGGEEWASRSPAHNDAFCLIRELGQCADKAEIIVSAFQAARDAALSAQQATDEGKAAAIGLAFQQGREAGLREALSDQQAAGEAESYANELREIAGMLAQQPDGPVRWKQYRLTAVADYLSSLHATPQPTETKRIVASLLDELILLAHQYRNDLIYPLADDSRERRIAAIDAVLAKTGEK